MPCSGTWARYLLQPRSLVQVPGSSGLPCRSHAAALPDRRIASKILVQISVHKGQVVTEGTTLLVVEAMKMELMLKAPYHCTVDDILVQQGQVVQEAVPLICLRNETI